MGKLSRIVLAIVLASVAWLGAQGIGSAAFAAAPTVAASGWLGTCYPQRNVHYGWGGGWCDGNGPDWTYRGVVHCVNGGTYFGEMRWAGDRRKSIGYCAGNVNSVWGGLYYYHNGLYVGSSIV
jgi:hypothetical protein